MLHEEFTKIPPILGKKVQSTPQSQVLSNFCFAKLLDMCQSCNRFVIPTNRLEDECSIVLTSSQSEIDDKSKVFLSPINISHIQKTLNNRIEVTVPKN